MANGLFDYFGNMNIFGATPGGQVQSLLDNKLITKEAVERANKQSIGSGLITGLASYLAQPKNQGYGDSTPYLAKAFLNANQAAQVPFTNLPNQYAMDTKIKENQRVLGERNKTQETINKMIENDPTLADLRGAPLQQQIAAINENTKQRFAIKKPLSIDDQMDKIIFDINAKKGRGEELTLTDESNLKAATQVKLMSSSDPSGLQSAMLPGAEKGAEGQAKDFGKIANEWTIGNKASDAQKLILDLEDVSKSLSTSDDITGGFIGALPPFAKERFYPQAVATQERLEGVVQRGLRETLGAQFAKEEGELLIKRAYNPSLPEEENLKRVNRLLATMKIAIQRKNEAVEYYYKNGNTLSGFDYKPITIQDFLDVLPETSVDTVKSENREELIKKFPKPAKMDDETYQSILNNL